MKYILFDTETTGNTENDRIIQVGAMIIDSEKYSQSPVYTENLFDSIVENKVIIYDELCQSDVQISLEAMEIHNITPEMIATRPSFKELEFYKALNKYNNSQNYLIAHNIQFDLGMLQKEGFVSEYKLIDTLKCAKVVFADLSYHRLQYLRYALGLYRIEKSEASNLGISIKAHDAIGDVLVMKLLLDELLKHKDYDELCKITSEPLISTKFSFGKYKGMSFAEVKEIDYKYLSWAANNIEDKDLVYSIKKFLESC